MDKLAKIFYQKKFFLYKYKGVVEVPVLGMVDDVLNMVTSIDVQLHSKCVHGTKQVETGKFEMWQNPYWKEKRRVLCVKSA